MLKFLTALHLFILIAVICFAQDKSANKKYTFELKLCLFDYSYDARAFQTSEDRWFSAFFKPFEVPGMSRSLEFSTDIYTLAHYGVSKIEFKNNNFLTRLISNSALSLTDILLLYLPGGSAWLHEEYHRAVLAENLANSFNGINRFPLFSGLVSVDHVLDEDLARIKNTNNSDFVRLMAAGIEGELMLTRQLEINNFFYNYQLPNLFVYWFSALNSRSYIALCAKPGADEITNEILQTETDDMAIRDFTGLDFTAWAYDLTYPNQDYSQRGVHPSGTGYDRYIKFSDLNIEAVNFLKKQSYLSYLNLFSPAFLGYDHISFVSGGKNQKTDINFAFSHFLTSFGNDISFHLFFKRAKLNLLLGYHNYSNHQRSFPGIELQSFNNSFQIKNTSFKINPAFMLWIQPENFDFKTDKGFLGALLSITLSTNLSERWLTEFSFDTKTRGWVAGNVFQEKNTSFKIKIGYAFGKL